MKVRTRIAPSPTGFLHIATIRQSLYCFALAKKHGGQFILRIEDTDQTRFVEGATEEIFEMHKEFGLVPDESIENGGDYGPYIQSQRLEKYKEYANKLLESDNAYYCFLSREEQETLQTEFKGRGFRSPYRNSSREEIQKLMDEGKPYVIRLKVPEKEIIEYEDGILGKLNFDTSIVNDEILIKSNGVASYHLAVVVDDHLMKITHPIRAVEWLPSTPKQILIYRYLGWEMPPFYHPPVILDPEGGKLSKRKGNVSAKQFLVEGYLVDAILNFIMFLGWAAPIKREHGEKEREIFSLQEFIDMFDLKDINKSNSVFNREKLLWFNKEYIKNMSAGDLQNKLIHWVEKFAKDIDPELKDSLFADPALDKKLDLVKERSNTLIEVVNSLKFFYFAPKNIDWEIKQLNKVDNAKLPEIREDIAKLIESFDSNSENWTHEEWEKGMREIGDKYGIKHGDVFMILRVALVGTPFSPPLFEAMQILGKDESLRRIYTNK